MVRSEGNDPHEPQPMQRGHWKNKNKVNPILHGPVGSFMTHSWCNLATERLQIKVNPIFHGPVWCFMTHR